MIKKICLNLFTDLREKIINNPRQKQTDVVIMAGLYLIILCIVTTAFAWKRYIIQGDGTDQGDPPRILFSIHDNLKLRHLISRLVPFTYNFRNDSRFLWANDDSENPSGDVAWEIFWSTTFTKKIFK